MRWGVGAERVPYHGDAHWARGPHQAAQGRHPRRDQAPPPCHLLSPKAAHPGGGREADCGAATVEGQGASDRSITCG